MMRFLYFNPPHLVHPTDVEFSISKNICDQGHVGPHVSFLSNIQAGGQRDTFGIDKSYNWFHFRNNKSTCLHKIIESNKVDGS